MAEEAKAISAFHQRWIVDTLKERGDSCTYEELVKVGEEKQCDTLGAMLRVLKGRKIVAYDEPFLMYPMHKDHVVNLIGDLI
ncbi:hypothetical protein DQ04_01231050 [Trypanosoma grayi]|uniref:hypothetical protein n=1 Tax=Trypanosoma grayi TaxID=71804 RepID=UPI0004F453C8|nr:hypothetical protein DQ04_01231050 [Trypanosoma grayi]KEG13070.1 hypothetical protein DQ04_01231050 [Trypanosoma grayi]